MNGNSLSGPAGVSHPLVGTTAGAVFIATSGVRVSLSGTSPSTASVHRCVFALTFLALAAVYEHRSRGLLLTPVGALLLGAIVLAERPTPPQPLGCALILGSVIVVTSRRSSLATT